MRIETRLSDQSLERTQGGLGIGLSLVQRIVEMHGGSVLVHSEGLGKGSEFTIRLPVVVERPTITQRVASEHSKMPIANLRILVVDDNQDSANTLGMMLRIMGNEVEIANDGEQAVRAAAEFQPDVVLLDIGLPKINGYEAARQIRDQPSGKKIVLIALTGWGQEEDKRQAQEAGVDLHMVKPVDPTSLMSILAELHTAKASTSA